MDFLKKRSLTGLFYQIPNKNNAIRGVYIGSKMRFSSDCELFDIREAMG